MPTRRALPLVLSIALLAALLPAGSAAASEVYNLDPGAKSNGNVVFDGADNAYIAWTHEEAASIETPVFCRILAGTGGCTSPNVLTIPGAASLSDSASAAFPVVGAGSTVYVVAPRYALNDVVVYTSVNGGASFDAGTIHKEGYSSQTDPTNVLPFGAGFLIGGYNAALGVSTTPSAPGNGKNLVLTPGNLVGSSSLGLNGDDPVLAYWTLTDPYSMRYFRYDGSGPIEKLENWVGPTPIANGYETKLSGGPAGLFLVSADQVGTETPSIVSVRKYSGTSFGAPVVLANDGAPSLFAGGAIAQSPNGNRLSVAWPARRGGDGKLVMRLFTSTDGGAGFAKTEIADLSEGFYFGDTIQLALSNGTDGWLTFINDAGLHLVDLYPIAGPPPTGDPPKPPDYKGKTKVADAKKAGDFEFTLRLPQSCVQSRQAFFAGVGKRKRRGLSKTLGGKVKFKQVVFIFDGKKLKVKKKKPFRYLIDPGAMAAGSTHVVVTKVTATLTKAGKSKKVKRTLKGSIKAC